MKTNQELIRIFTLYNGTNDVSAQFPPLKRIRSDINWSFKHLNLFKNSIQFLIIDSANSKYLETRNTRPHNHQPPILQFAKSLAQVALSREAVDYMLDEMNLDTLMDALEWDVHGVDEQLIGTLNSNDAVEMPNGFTLQCLKKGYEAESLMRCEYTLLI